jgi:hypothetical protein
MGNGSGTFACQVTFFSPQADSVKIAAEHDLSAADVENQTVKVTGRLTSPRAGILIVSAGFPPSC